MSRIDVLLEKWLIKYIEEHFDELIKDKEQYFIIRQMAIELLKRKQNT